MGYRVKAVADMAGISVRMLHHYDRIGLLKPESVSPAGYRLYSDRDLERLQEIMFFRELDFGLGLIKDIMDSPAYDRRRSLESHLLLLRKKRQRLESIIATLGKSIASMERGEVVKKKEQLFAAPASRPVRRRRW